MRLYHETRGGGALDSIQREGFRDSDAMPHLDIPAGVWLTDSPTATAATGGSGHRLCVEIPEDVAAKFLVAGSPGELLGRWREFCIPAEIVNGYPRLDTFLERKAGS